MADITFNERFKMVKSFQVGHKGLVIHGTDVSKDWFWIKFGSEQSFGQDVLDTLELIGYVQMDNVLMMAHVWPLCDHDNTVASSCQLIGQRHHAGGSRLGREGRVEQNPGSIGWI